jgi:hypothetical protein
VIANGGNPLKGLVFVFDSTSFAHLEFIRNDDYKDKIRKAENFKVFTRNRVERKVQNSRRTLQVETAIL